MSEMRLGLDLDVEDLMTAHTVVYLAWRDDLLLDVYATAAGAETALADYRLAFPAAWQQLPTGRWFVPGQSRTLFIEPRAVLAALPIIHADVPADTEEAI